MAVVELVGAFADVVRFWHPDSTHYRAAESKCKILQNAEGPERGSGPPVLKLVQGLPEHMLLKVSRLSCRYDQAMFEARSAPEESSVLYKRMQMLLLLLKFLRACEWQGLPGVSAALKKIQEAEAELNESGCNVSIFSYNADGALEKWHKAQQKAGALARSSQWRAPVDDGSQQQQQQQQQQQGRQQATDSLTWPLLSASS